MFWIILFTIISFNILFGGGLNDSDGNGLFHISNGKSSEWGILSETFTAKWLGRFHDNKSWVSVFDEFGFLLGRFTSSSVDFSLNFLEFAGNVGSVAVQNWGVSILNLSRVIHNNDLSKESFNLSWGIILRVSCNISSLDILNWETFNVESDIVSWNSFRDRFVMHFNWFNVTLNIGWGESNIHSWLKDTSFNSTDWDSSNTSNLVDVLKRKSKRFFSWSFWGFNFIKSLDKSWTFVPWGVGWSF